MSLHIKSCCSRWVHRLCLLLGVALLFAGCSVGKPSDTIRIGVAVYDQQDTFISTILKNMEQIAQQAEIDNQVKINLSVSDGGGNQTKQLEQIGRYLNQGYDMVCVNLVDRTSAAIVIDKAEDADIPIVFFNREPVEEDINRWEKVYYVGAKAQQSGTLQGELVVDAWEKDHRTLDKNRDGILQYVMLEGEPGHQDALLRTEYVIKSLTDHHMQVERLVGDTANWNRGQAKAKVQKWIEAFGDEIEAVLSNNDDMALGAIDAFEDAGLKIPLVVGVDATKSALEAIEQGKLYGTVLNDGYGMAETMIHLALCLRNIAGCQMPSVEDGHYIWLPYQTVEKEDMIIP